MKFKIGDRVRPTATETYELVGKVDQCYGHVIEIKEIGPMLYCKVKLESKHEFFNYTLWFPEHELEPAYSIEGFEV